ncbi:MAG: CoA ester lyase [Chloroflexota bacterium]|nr:CoA ester lyase [Chloroflexota bacterium]MDE3192660.1 CoA ester lyase [Chloroflexota bacterium]
MLPLPPEDLRRAPPRSWLFVPALRAPEWIPKAVASGADALIVDLEDATAPDEKDRARDVVRGLGLAHGQRSPVMAVRVNSGPRERHEADLRAAVDSGASAVLLPKIEEPEEVRAAGWTGLAMVVMIETAKGLLRAADIATAHDHLVALAFGSFDLSAELGAAPSREGIELLYARSHVVTAAAAAGAAAIDTPWVDIKDAEGCAREAAAARRLGFSGKLAIHPSHVASINAAFSPSDDEIADAEALLAAFDKAVAAGAGVATYQGRMIDRPLALAARRVLARAGLARR